MVCKHDGDDDENNERCVSGKCITMNEDAQNALASTHALQQHQ